MGEKFRYDELSHVAFRPKHVGVVEISSHHPDVRLLRESNQVSQNTNSVAVMLHLSEDDIAGVERGADRSEVALLTWDSEQGGVADDAVLSPGGNRQVGDNGVGKPVGERVHFGGASLVIEARHCDVNGRRFRVKQECRHRERRHSERDSEPVSGHAARELGRQRGGSDELVAAFGNGPNVPRRLRGIAQRGADLRDAVVQPGIEIDKRAATPNRLTQLIACDYFAGMLEQHAEYLRGLCLQAHRRPVAPQFPGGRIEFENAKPNAGHSTRDYTVLGR